jgi:fermentation-respiration switch protein FrsA (DUF1100 family)
MKKTVFFSAVMLLSSCGGVFFYPDRSRYASPDELGISYEENVLDDGGGPKLVTWLLKAENPKALIVHLHGNAENMSSHLGGVYWLPARGYDVLLSDYRGYGGSQGEASVSGVNADVARIFRYAKKLSAERREPLVLFGQSIGASLGLYAAAQPEFAGMFKAIVSECAFSSYRAIAHEKLVASWIALVFGSPFLLTVPESYSPLPVVGKIQTGGLLFVHGEADAIVDVHHADLLFAAAPQPKELWKVPEAGHISAFKKPEWRDKLVQFVDARL